MPRGSTKAGAKPARAMSPGGASRMREPPTPTARACVEVKTRRAAGDPLPSSKTSTAAPRDRHEEIERRGTRARCEGRVEGHDRARDHAAERGERVHDLGRVAARAAAQREARDRSRDAGRGAREEVAAEAEAELGAHEA